MITPTICTIVASRNAQSSVVVRRCEPGEVDPCPANREDCQAKAAVRPAAKWPSASRWANCSPATPNAHDKGEVIQQLKRRRRPGRSFGSRPDITRRRCARDCSYCSSGRPAVAMRRCHITDPFWQTCEIHSASNRARSRRVHRGPKSSHPAHTSPEPPETQAGRDRPVRYPTLASGHPSTHPQLLLCRLRPRPHFQGSWRSHGHTEQDQMHRKRGLPASARDQAMWPARARCEARPLGTINGRVSEYAGASQGCLAEDSPKLERGFG